MLVKVLKAKIHRATVTAAHLDYVGSITIDPVICERVGIMPYECVLVADLTNGARLETYVLYGEPGSGAICMNGAAAHLIKPGDMILVFSWGLIPAEQVPDHRPRIILVDEKNRPDRLLTD